MVHELDEVPNPDRRDEVAGSSSADEVTAGNPYNLSRGTRLLFRIVAVTLVVSMTALFLRGFFHL